MWEHQRFSSVKDSGCDKAGFDWCQEHIALNTGMHIYVGDMVSIVNDVSCNKSPGLDCLTAEHIK